MSDHAIRIESARRIYTAALNTPAEQDAKANLERIIAESGTTAAVEVGPPDWCAGHECPPTVEQIRARWVRDRRLMELPDWCCGARCRHCTEWSVCK